MVTAFFWTMVLIQVLTIPNLRTVGSTADFIKNPRTRFVLQLAHSTNRNANLWEIHFYDFYKISSKSNKPQIWFDDYLGQYHCPKNFLLHSGST